jgi:ankyrin repeat protein
MKVSRNAIFTSIRKNDIDFLKQSLDNGLDVNLTEKLNSGNTIIEYAAYLNNFQISSLVLNYNPNLKLTKRLLFWAAYHSNFDLFKLFIDYNAPQKDLLDECLCESCSKDNYKIAALCIQLGANPNYRQKDLYPLHRVARYGSIDIAKLLVENGAVVDVFDYKLRTPFHYSALYDNYDVMEYLFENGANSDGVVVSNGILTSAYVGSSEMLKFYNVLIKKDPTKLIEFKEWLKVRLRFLKGGELETELKNYILNSDIINFKRLLSNKISEMNLNVGYYYDYMEGVTPLHLAIMTNNPEMVSILLLNGADINSVTNRNMNAYSFINSESPDNKAKEIYDLLQSYEKRIADERLAKKEALKNYESKFVETVVEKKDGVLHIKVLPKKK